MFWKGMLGHYWSIINPDQTVLKGWYSQGHLEGPVELNCLNKQWNSHDLLLFLDTDFPLFLVFLNMNFSIFFHVPEQHFSPVWPLYWFKFIISTLKCWKLSYLEPRQVGCLNNSFTALTRGPGLSHICCMFSYFIKNFKNSLFFFVKFRH